MRNFSLSRTGACANWMRNSILAWGPLGAALACNVYDDSLTGVMTPLGGSGSSAAAGSDAGGKSSNGGKSSDGGGGASAGKVSGGSGGDEVSGSGGTGGSAGSATAGGGSGGTNIAGNGGTANGGGGSGGTAPTDVELIDDMEDGDAGILPNHGRNGYWYTGGDTTKNAVLTPPANAFAMTMLAAGDRSDYAASVKAENFTDWGSVIGFNFVEKNSMPQPYDASAYCGVHFWGKAAAPVTLRLRVPDVSTHPNGGVCVTPGTSGTACYDHFGSAVAFGKVWADYSFKFADLTQVGTGYHPADNKIRTDKLFAMEWALPGGATAKTYQIWVDDVELLKCP